MSLRFYATDDRLVCSLRLCAKPSWSLVWRLLWHVTHDAPTDPSQYYDLLRMRPSPGILFLTAVERLEPQVTPPSLGRHRIEHSFDPATTTDPLPVESKAYIVRGTYSASAIRPTMEPVMTGSKAHSSASSASSSSTRPNTPQLGKNAVRNADGQCCFDSVNRAFEDDGSIRFTGLQGIHLFPRSYKEEWARWDFGRQCTHPAVFDIDDDDRIDCVNNLMLAGPSIHLAWDQMEIAIDPFDGNRVVEFRTVIVPYRSPVTFSHRASPETRPLELLLLHHLRQCFLACIPRTTKMPISPNSPLKPIAGPISSPSTNGLPTPPDKPLHTRRSPRVRKKMSNKAPDGGHEASGGNTGRTREIAMNITQLERIERWLMDVR